MEITYKLAHSIWYYLIQYLIADMHLLFPLLDKGSRIWELWRKLERKNLDLTSVDRHSEIE